MPIFDLMAFLTKLLGGGGLAGVEDGAITKLKELTRQFPDSRERVEYFAAWITETLAPAYDVAAMRETIWGIASDIVNGTAGSDPDAWTGSV